MKLTFKVGILVGSLFGVANSQFLEVLSHSRREESSLGALRKIVIQKKKTPFSGTHLI